MVGGVDEKLRRETGMRAGRSSGARASVRVRMRGWSGRRKLRMADGRRAMRFLERWGSMERESIYQAI
jgi:hypothetical protein